MFLWYAEYFVLVTMSKTGLLIGSTCGGVAALLGVATLIIAVLKKRGEPMKTDSNDMQDCGTYDLPIQLWNHLSIYSKSL